jgi:L-alanine-DL-glutamate epimerase-like enolase superfamily enzyme
MRPQSLIFTSLPIPFRTAFAHASASRTEAENVVACAVDAGGHAGLGEGCPRQYVTGETLGSAMAFLAQHRESLAAIEDLEALEAWVAAHGRQIDANPSAFCAAELALLDLFAQQAGKPVEELLEIGKGKPLTVSAIYGASAFFKFEAQALLFQANGIHDAKLKLTGNVGQDRRRVRRLAVHGDVRLDANNLWPGVKEATPALNVIGDAAWAVEEPIRARDWAGMNEIWKATGLAIIADESLVTLADLDSMPRGEEFVANLRVSKLGGLLRSLGVLARVVERGQRAIVGAQVGETSVLARAGAALAAAAGDALIGYEGAYAPRLLSEDAAAPALTFGPGGVVDLTPFEGRPGWGLAPTEVLAEALRRA